MRGDPVSLRLILGAAALAGALSGPAQAQEMGRKPACAAVSDAGLPAPLSGWTARTDLVAARDEGGVDKAVLPLGRGVDAKLNRTGDIAYPVLPERPGGSVSYGGLYAVDVTEAGDYQVSLGSGAWIEMIRGTALVTSTAHAPGPACSTLKKTVVFPLTPGRYLLAITGNGDAVLPVMVTRVVP
jgi:hypothetical protein